MFGRTIGRQWRQNLSCQICNFGVHFLGFGQGKNYGIPVVNIGFHICSLGILGILIPIGFLDVISLLRWMVKYQYFQVMGIGYFMLLMVHIAVGCVGLYELLLPGG